jgi:hypothetical protein
VGIGVGEGGKGVLVGGTGVAVPVGGLSADPLQEVRAMIKISPTNISWLGKARDFIWLDYKRYSGI